jgi:deoxyxylulose-5-phosphate synthase
MNAKDFLGQAFRLDCRINSKLEQIEALNCLATKVTAPAVNDMPGSPNRNIHQMEDVIVKVMDMRDDLKEAAKELLELKQQIMGVIQMVEDTDQRTLLELRYLCFKTWEDIAADMNFGTRYIHILHGKALAEVDDILEKI